MLDWLTDLGRVVRVGVEGTGSYGAGLSRYLQSSGISVVEVNRADRQDRRRQGKSDPLDAISAARAAQSGRAAALPKGGDGEVEAIRMLLVAKRSARRSRTMATNQLRSLLTTAPDDLREQFAHHSTRELVAGAALLRHRSGDLVDGPPA